MSIKKSVFLRKHKACFDRINIYIRYIFSVERAFGSWYINREGNRNLRCPSVI